MLLRIHPDNPDERKIRQAVKILKQDGLVVIPTDTVYSFACELGSAKGLERIARLKEIPLNKARFSIACADLSQLSSYTRPLDNWLFKLMRKTLPGPYTFILPASSMVPKWFMRKRKNIGIRVPDHPVTLALLKEINRPLIVSSVRDEDIIVEYTTDPETLQNGFRVKWTRLLMVEWVRFTPQQSLIARGVSPNLFVRVSDQPKAFSPSKSLSLGLYS